MIQAPPKVAAIWFGDNERAKATTIGALAGPVGSVIGFMFPLFFVFSPQNNVFTELAKAQI